MDEIDSFLDECAVDSFFRVSPDKLDIVRTVMTKLYQAGDDCVDSQSTWNRIREIFTARDRTPRERCKELLPFLLQKLELPDRSPAPDPATASQSSYAARSTVSRPGQSVNVEATAGRDVKQAQLNTVDSRDSEVGTAVRSLLEIMWALQGRMNALELVMSQVIEAIVVSHADPQIYMREFVGRLHARAASANVGIPAKAERDVKERDTALAEFLADLLEKAAPLKRD